MIPICESTIRHGQDNYTVIEQVMHNASTALDELEVVRAIRVLPERVASSLLAAMDNFLAARNALIDALDALPKIGGP